MYTPSVSIGTNAAPSRLGRDPAYSDARTYGCEERKREPWRRPLVEPSMKKLAEVSGSPVIGSQLAPPVSRGEGEDEVPIAMDPPSVPRESIRVAVNHGLLEIAGSRHQLSSSSATNAKWSEGKAPPIREPSVSTLVIAQRGRTRM